MRRPELLRRLSGAAFDGGEVPLRLSPADGRAWELFRLNLDKLRRTADRITSWAIAAQWAAALGLALWNGFPGALRLALLGGALISVPILALTRLQPGWRRTRMFAAAGQLLWSPLLLALAGSQMQVHHHLLCSLALVALYRDAAVLLPVALVPAALGLLPAGALPGVLGAWTASVPAPALLAMTVVLGLGLLISRSELQAISWRQAEQERLAATFEERVQQRTVQLERSREQFRLLVETTRTVPWQMDAASLRFTYVGPQAAALLGCPSEEWLRPDFWKRRLHPADRRGVTETFARCLAQGSNEEVEYRLSREGGGWVWVRNIVSSGGPGQQALRGMILDVTERRRLEMELQQAQKLESVGRLAAGIAHEINTPVQFVSDSVHFLKESVGDLLALLGAYGDLRELAASVAPELAAELRAAEEAADLDYLREECPKAIDRAIEGLGRVATIVRSMKAFAHPDLKEMAATDLNAAIETTLVIARHEYKYVAEVETDLGELPQVTCHIGEINQVFLNLMVNAAHAIGDVVEGTGQRGRIKVTTRADGERVRVSVSDTGCGIPEPLRARVFDPFFTTKQVGKGTGQGLSIARSVVEKHGGVISFESEVGRGTTFHVDLPLRPAAGQKKEAA